MISKPLHDSIITVSVKVYQTLLHAYPTKFQQEYGSQMVQVFQDCCLRTVRRGGTNGMFRLWTITLLDLLQSVISEHTQKEIEMKKEMKPEDILMAGWAFIWGSFALALSMFAGVLGESAWFVITITLTFICLPLLTMGMLGLRSRYGDKAGGFGKTMLLVGAILGPITSVLGFFLQNVVELWTLIFIGPSIQLSCLALFGLIGLYKEPLPRWNVLPLIAGLWFPIRLLPDMITALLTGDWPAEDSLSIADAVFGTLQVTALVALGYILKSDVPEETAAPA